MNYLESVLGSPNFFGGVVMEGAASYRRAREEDCHELAVLIQIASTGVAEFLFQGLMDGQEPVEIIERGLRAEAPPNTWRNAWVAEKKGRVAGALLAYPSVYHGLTEEMRRFFPPDRLNHLADFFAARVENSLYIDTLGVHRGFRRQGLAKGLIRAAAKEAGRKGLSSLSLIVFRGNLPALSLYEAMGFRRIRKIRLDPHPLIHYREGCLLLEAPAMEMD
jgi:ribosomal protein S18 acetylase RimI-like enzyme